MKKRIIIVLLCALATHGTVDAQQSKNVEPRKFVSAESGLILREGAGRSFNKITLIPFDSEVIVKSRSDVSESISGKTGYWIKAEWVNPEDNLRYEGWCFDAFLSNTKTFKDRDAALNIKINKNYRMSIPAIKDTDKDANAPGTLESRWQNILFLPDKKFTFSINSRISAGRGKTFDESIEYSGTYTVTDNSIRLKYLKCEKVNSPSSAKDEVRQEITLSLAGCPTSLKTAGNKENCYLKSDKGDLYIYNNKSGN